MYIFTTVSSRFAKPDAIIDLWEKYNVPNGADILLVSMAHHIYMYSLYPSVYIYMQGYNESTESRLEPTTMATPPSTTPVADATNCATETSPKKDVQEALIYIYPKPSGR